MRQTILLLVCLSTFARHNLVAAAQIAAGNSRKCDGSRHAARQMQVHRNSWCRYRHCVTGPAAIRSATLRRVSVWRELDTAVVSVGIFGRTGVNRLEFAETGGDHAIRLDAFVLSCGPATRQDPSSDRRPNLPHHHARGSRAEPLLHSDIP